MASFVYRDRVYDFESEYCAAFALSLALKLRDIYKVGDNYVRIVFLYGRRFDGDEMVESCIHCMVELNSWQSLNRCTYIDSDVFSPSEDVLGDWMEKWKLENQVVYGPHIWYVALEEEHLSEFKRECKRRGSDISNEALEAANHFINCKWDKRLELNSLVRTFFEGLRARKEYVRSVSGCTA